MMLHIYILLGTCINTFWTSICTSWQCYGSTGWNSRMETLCLLLLLLYNIGIYELAMNNMDTFTTFHTCFELASLRSIP